MFGTILFRMILWELCKVFVISLLAITGILLMAGIIAEATQQGLGPAQILAAIPLLVPSTLPYTIPATTLFATCVVYGRLAGDNEILAIKMAGVNVLQVVKPGIVLGLAVSLVTVVLYHRTIPYTHHLLRSMVLNDVEEFLYSVLSRHGSILHPKEPYLMFVKGVQGKKLISPVFKRKNERGQIDLVAYAREAELRVDMAKGVLLIWMHNGNFKTEDGDGIHFDKRMFDVPLPEITQDSRRARDMTWEELVERKAELEEELQEKSAEIDRQAELLEQDGGPGEQRQHVRNLQNQHREIRAKIRLIYVEQLMRPALSFGCLCFILVGCPIGILFSRGDYLGAFMTCFLPIVLVYYPLVLCGTNLAKEGRFNEIVLVYAADVFVALAGLSLFRWLLKH